MRDALVLDLADCTEFRQALQARPPKVVHGTALLLAALLGAALGWSALTEAALVVRTAGRIRPVTTPVRVFNAARGEGLGAGVGGRVVEVNAREGDVVSRGAVLVRLDTERLDNEIGKQERVIRAGEEELARLAHLDTLMTGQSRATRAKVEAEVAQARESVRLAEERRAGDVRVARSELELARGEESRSRRLQQRGATTQVELDKAMAQARMATDKLEKARLPVERGALLVLERALELVERDDTVKRTELEVRRGARQAEVEVARAELANRKLERRQAVISAPMDGVVTSGDVKVGDVLEAGRPVAEIAEQAGFRFEVMVPSEEVGHLRVGMATRIKLDTYDYQRFGTMAGTVCFIAPDSVVLEGRRQAVFVVKIALAGDHVGHGVFRGRVKLGMGGLAEIVTGREGLLSILLKKIRRSISLG